MVVYVIQNNGGNENSPDSLNGMVNYHYHGENRVITRSFPSMATRPEPLRKRRHSEDSGVYCTLLSPFGTQPMIGCYATNVCHILFLVTLFRMGQNSPVVTSMARPFASALAGLGAIP